VSYLSFLGEPRPHGSGSAAGAKLSQTDRVRGSTACS